MFVAVDDGLMVVCDSWAGRSGGAAACEEDGSSVSGDGVGSGDCDLDPLDRKRSLNLTGISIRTFATLQLEEREKYVRNGVTASHRAAAQGGAILVSLAGQVKQSNASLDHPS